MSAANYEIIHASIVLPVLAALQCRKCTKRAKRRFEFSNSTVARSARRAVVRIWFEFSENFAGFRNGRQQQL